MSDLLAQTESLFHEMRALDRDAQILRLEQIGAQAPSLRATVEALLQADRTPDDRLDRPIRDVILEEIRATEGRLRSEVEDTFRQLAPAGRPSERYRDRTEIGRGGMGVVYRVHDATLDRELAMKVVGGTTVPDERTDSVHPDQVLRFLREARVLARLDHPGIVPIHDVGIDESGRPFFTMKLVQCGESTKDPLGERRTLQDVLDLAAAGDPNWSQVRLLEVLLRVCDAIDYANSRGVIHRDLKPSNVMVGRFGEVYVMDWGLARIQGDSLPAAAPGRASSEPSHQAREKFDRSALLTLTGDLLGTPEYMAPEQARGDIAACDRRTDVFGVGALLYRMVTGAAPYGGGSRAEVIQNAAAGRLAEKPDRRRSRPAPVELAAICSKAMSVDPTRRYENVAQLQSDVRSFLDDRESATWRLPMHRRVYKLVRRKPAAATAAIGSALLVTVAALAGARVFAAEERGRVLDEQRRLTELPQTMRRIDEAETPGSFVISSGPAGSRVQMPDATDQQLLEKEKNFSGTAERFLDLLESWNVELRGPDGAVAAATALRHAPLQARESLMLALYRLAEHQFINGVAAAVYVEAHPELDVPNRAKWIALAARHERLANAARSFVPVLEALGDQQAGLATYDAMVEWGLHRRDAVTPLFSFIATASTPEVEFITQVLTQVRATDEVIEALDRATQRQPGSFWLRARQLHARVRRAAAETDSDKRREGLSEAVIHGEAAMALWSESLTVPLSLAMVYQDLGNVARAEKLLIDLTARRPDFADGWINLGSLYKDQGRWSDAIAALRTATKLAPTDPAAFKLLGLAADECFTSLDGHDPLSDPCAETAVESFRQVIELDPDDWEGPFRLGCALMAIGKLDEADSAFDAALRLNPKSVDVRNFKAENLVYSGRVGEALELTLAVLGDKPDSESALESFPAWLQEIDNEAQRNEFQRRFDQLHAGK